MPRVEQAGDQAESLCLKQNRYNYSQLLLFLDFTLACQGAWTRYRCKSRGLEKPMRWNTTTWILTCLALCPAGLVRAGVHTWEVNEVFSDSTGTIQYVELWEAPAAPNGELGVPGQTMTSTLTSFTISGPALTGSTADTYYLMATPDFAALAGAPTPDALIPAGSIPFFNTAGDSVAFSAFDTWTFGTVPTDGVNSLKRGLDGETAGPGTNSPTNFAGATGSVTVPPPPGVPSWTWSTQLLMLTMLLTAGIVTVRRFDMSSGFRIVRARTRPRRDRASCRPSHRAPSTSPSKFRAPNPSTCIPQRGSARTSDIRPHRSASKRRHAVAGFG